MESHLLQMRGLKRDFCYTFTLFEQVASFTDAWIETTNLLYIIENLRCRIFYRCVD